MLKIYTSRYNTLVEKTMFDMAIQSFENGGESYLFVPEQYTLQNEINLMNRIQKNAVSGIRIMSFQRLALETLSKLGGLKRTYIDNLGKTMVLKNILYKGNLSLYSGSINKEGFVQSVLNQIAELKRTMITPHMLLELAEKTQDHGMLAQKLKELAYIYEEMELVLSGQYVDNEDRLGQLSELKDMNHLKDTEIFIYGFLDFTAIELEIIKNLVTSGVKVHIGLCLDEDSSENMDETVFFTTQKTKYQLEKAVREGGAPLSLHKIPGHYEGQRENLRLLGENLFKTIPGSFDAEPKGLEIYGAHSSDEELHYIARDIAKKVVENDFRYKDFMVTSAQEEVYNPSAKQIFAQYQIPLFIDEKRTIINSPIIKTILAILSLLGEEFKTEDVMVFLKNGFSQISQNSIYTFENYMIRRKFRGRMFFEDKYFEPKGPLNEKQIHEMEIVMEVREYLLSIFKGPAEKAKAEHTAREYSEMIMEILDKINMFQEIQKFIDELRKNNLLDEANENNQIWNIVVNIWEQASAIFDQEKMDINRFKNLFEEAVKSHKLAVIPPSSDQVIFGDMDRSRSDSKKIVYLCGVNSGSVPASYKESSILTQEEKMIIGKNGMSLPSEKDQVLSNDMLTLYILINSANQGLTLSYSTEGGKSPAMILEQAMDIFPKLKIKTPGDIEEEDLISTPRATLPIMSKQLKGLIRGQETDSVWVQVLAHYLKNQDTREMAEVALSGIQYNNQKENIQNAKALYKDRLKLSTTRLLSFVECPFKHFVKYGLKAGERKEYAIQSAEVGIVLHETMEQFISKLVEESALIHTLTKEQTDKIIDEYFDKASRKILDEYHINDSRNQFLLERQRSTARHIGQLSLEHIKSGEFTLYKQEAKFGDEATDSEIKLLIDDEKVNLVGTIDRIDILKEEGKIYVKIIDYKTRDKKFSLSDAYNGIDIQLLLYLYAALNAIKDPQSEILPAGAFYFPVINPIVETSEREPKTIEKQREDRIKADGIVIDEEEILDKIGKIDKKRDGRNIFTLEEVEALIEHILSDINKNVSKMLSGEIQALPVSQNNGQRTACDYCRYASICRFEADLGDEYRVLYSYDHAQIRLKLKEEQKNKHKEEQDEHKLD